MRSILTANIEVTMTKEIYNFMNPTVNEVESILKLIAIKYQLEDFKQVHKILGVTDRTLRRWRSKSDIEPNNKSSIPTLASLAIYSINEGLLITRNWQELRDQIPVDYLMTAQSYVCPPSDFLKSLVGKNNILGVTIKELAKLLYCSHIQLGADIKREKLSYLTFSTILMLCGFKPFEVFNLRPDSVRNKIDPITNYLKDKCVINEIRNEELKRLATRYLIDYPELKGNETRDFPLYDLNQFDD